MRNELFAAMVVVGLFSVVADAGTIQTHTWVPWRRHIDPNQLANLARQTIDPHAGVRAKAIEEIARSRAVETWEVVAERLGDKAVVHTQVGTTTVAAVACAALGLLGEQRAVPCVIPLLEDPALRGTASKALYLLKHRFQVGNLQITDLLQDTGQSPERGKERDLLDPLCGSDPVNWQAWWIRQGLAGREIVVRLYKDPDGDPAAFDRVKAKVAGEGVLPGTIPLRAVPGADPCSVIVICPQDQQDEDLRLMMGQWITVRRVSEGKSLQVPDRLWQIPGNRRIPDRWPIEDALGEPIAGASVELWLRPMQAGRGRAVHFGRWIASEGSIEAIQIGGGFVPEFVVSHPSYGRASAPAMMPQADRVRVPLVRLSSEAGSRAICGTVVDDSGRPAPDVAIECTLVRVRSGNPVEASLLAGIPRAITDAYGFFALYVPPNDRSGNQVCRLIPPGSSYRIVVEPAVSSGLLPCEISIENGTAARIELERAGNKLRTFLFETDDGPLKDVERLRRIAIEVHRPGRAPLKYPHSWWSGGYALPEGTYVATSQGNLQFEPVSVSDTSPETIVFQPPACATYSGSVVHARTGMPLAGMFVLVQTSRGRGTLSNLTDAQWDRLERLDRHPARDDEALRPVREAYGFLDVVRTNADGTYEIPVCGGTAFYGLIYFSRDYVPMQYQTTRLTPDASNRRAIPTIRLYPAARVQVQALANLERGSITAEWRLKEDQVPSWARELRPERKEGWLSFEHAGSYPLNIPQSICVPADVPLQLEIRALYADRLSPFTYPQLICLSQGMTMDLGPCTLPEAVMVILHVVGPDGEPREGVPVNNRIGNSLHLTHQTDENGLASFRVPQHSSGELGVFPFALFVRKAQQFKPETVAFEVGGTEDQGKQFTLVLSEELLAALSETGAEPLK